jgi:hypothetical protein
MNARLPEHLVLRLTVLVCACVFSLPLSAAAQRESLRTGAGVVDGVVTTQSGTIRLGGARVVILDAGNHEVASSITDGDGKFRVTTLIAGRYTVTASLDGFVFGKTTLVVESDAQANVALDLPLAAVNQTIEVTAPVAVVSVADTIAAAERIGSRETEQLTGGGGLGNALRLLASIVEVPGGLSIKGGRPTQAGVQMGASTLTDPVLGLMHLTLPDDAIDSVAVMPNPYAVEYGRFSSGLVVIQMRRGGDTWRMRLTNLTPTFRTERHKELFTITGLSGFGPNFAVGGPIVKERLFLEQTVQYRYSTDDIASRPEDERRTSHSVSSFSRVDANLSPTHSLIATGGFFPSLTKSASLGTFTPPDATVDMRERVNHATFSERALWSDSLVSESTVQARGYRGEVSPQGNAAMLLFPDTTLGNFYNHQIRTPKTFQFIQTLSGSAHGPTGLHLFKFGADVLFNDYDGRSESRPLLIFRPDGTLVRRFDFAAPRGQEIGTTDLAVFAQDRVQPSTRWYAEYGARLDRDGIVGRWNVTPRVGAALLLDASGDSVLRGGYGLFYERTPSAAGAFDQFERFTDTRLFDPASGGAAVPFVHVTGDALRTARSATWDLSYEYRVSSSLSFRAAMLDRRGDHELLLDTVTTGQVGALVLRSDGRSRYRDFEVAMHASRSTRFDLHTSYAHARAEGDLNAFANFFDTMMWPVVAPNQYGRLSTDVPHRLLSRTRLLPTPTWLVAAVADWRTGLPYSIVDEALDYVGVRNTQRMPTYFRLDVGLEHRFQFGKLQPWIGVRAYNALNAFLPADVQANIASPAFGSFYNSPFRQYRLQLRFGR